jgi:hypothetical protein
MKEEQELMRGQRGKETEDPLIRAGLKSSYAGIVAKFGI